MPVVLIMWSLERKARWCVWLDQVFVRMYRLSDVKSVQAWRSWISLNRISDVLRISDRTLQYHAISISLSSLLLFGLSYVRQMSF